MHPRQALGGLPLALALVLLVAGCETSPKAPPGAAANLGPEGSMKIESSAFEEGAPIPKRYTCSGEDVSPSLAIDDVPDAAKSLALIVDDPDAPRGTFVHWLLWNVPPTRGSIPEAVPPDGSASTLGPQTRQGKNGMGKTGYSGPCPPPGSAHTYRFQAFALDRMLDVPSGADRSALDGAMKGHVLAQAVLRGSFGR